MNYYELVQIKEYLKENKKIYKAYRVSDNCICLEFKEKLYFDLTRSNSSIYSGDIFVRNYQSPFDLQLKKLLFNANILDIKVPQNNRILEFHLSLAHAYKKYEFYLIFEFSGKYTNAIILDENRIIQSALRYATTSKRAILINEKYIDLEPTKITEPNNIISDFNTYFKDKFEQIKTNKLEQIKQQKINEITKKIEKLKLLLDSIEDENELSKKAELEYLRGETLKAHLYKLKDYERNFTLDGIVYTIKNSPSFELKNIFKNAKKLSQKAKNISIEKNNLLEKIESLENSIQAIKIAKDEIFVKSFTNKKDKNKSLANVLNFYVNDYKISVGLNENANEYLLKNSKKDDLWFHLKDLKGSHVIIASNKKKYDIDLIYHAASLCACYSGKKNGNFLVDFTQRKNVKIIEKAFVNYVNYDTIKVFL